MPCVCVCLSVSVTRRCSVETVERVGLVLAWELISAYPTLCYKKIRVSSKIRELPSGTLLRTLQSMEVVNFLSHLPLRS